METIVGVVGTEVDAKQCLSQTHEPHTFIAQKQQTRNCFVER